MELPGAHAACIARTTSQRTVPCFGTPAGGTLDRFLGSLFGSEVAASSPSSSDGGASPPPPALANATAASTGESKVPR